MALILKYYNYGESTPIKEVVYPNTVSLYSDAGHVYVHDESHMTGRKAFLRNTGTKLQDRDGLEFDFFEFVAEEIA